MFLADRWGEAAAVTPAHTIKCQFVAISLVLFYFIFCTMIAKQDQAACVYYLYASVGKTELPNSSDRTALKINREHFLGVSGLSGFLSYFFHYS